MDDEASAPGDRAEAFFIDLRNQRRSIMGTGTEMVFIQFISEVFVMAALTLISAAILFPCIYALSKLAGWAYSRWG